MRKGQKTQKKLEFRLKNKESRQKAGSKSCFWALIGTKRDESAFWGRRAGRRVSVSKSGLSRRDRDGWQVCKVQGKAYYLRPREPGRSGPGAPSIACLRVNPPPGSPCPSFSFRDHLSLAGRSLGNIVHVLTVSLRGHPSEFVSVRV